MRSSADNCSSIFTDSAGKYARYADVPFYRKNWFAILAFLFFMPILLLVLVTGPVYYEAKGQLKHYSTIAKVFLIAYSGLATFILIAVLSGVENPTSESATSSSEQASSASTEVASAMRY